MERHLSGRNHGQAPVFVKIGIRAEGFHHGLAVGFCVIGTLQHHRALRQRLLHVPCLKAFGGHQIAPGIRAHIAQRAEVFLRVYNNFIVQRLHKVQQGAAHLIGHPDQTAGPLSSLFRFRGHDGHRIACAAQQPVQD